MFADACTADAEDAYAFNTAVKHLMDQKDTATNEVVLKYLDLWSKNYEQFQTLTINPKIAPLKNVSETLSRTTLLMKNALETKTVSTENLNVIRTSLDVLSKPFVDVELVILEPLKTLLAYFETEYLKG